MNTQNDKSDPIHGNIYQLKLLMLFLYRGIQHKYSFRMGTEVKEAKKFDDLMFEYTEGDGKIFRLLQAKHRKDETKRITACELLAECDGDFSLIKYFFSYQDLKEEKLFQGGVIKDVIICTNINFNKSDLENSNIFVEEMSEEDDILDFNTTQRHKKSLRFKFRKGISPILKPKLENYHLIKLARKLIDCILNNKAARHHQQKGIFYTYHLALAEDVINVNDKNFQDKFIADENISPVAKRFRKIFENELTKITDNELTLENLNEAIAKKRSVLNKEIGLRLSKNFGQGNSLKKEWPQNVISNNDIDEFLNHLVFAVNQPNEEELGNIIKEEIGKEYGFISTKYIYYEVLERMLKLLQGKEGNRFITFQEGMELLKKCNEEIFLCPSLQYEYELHSTPYTFKRRGELQNFISSAERLWVMKSETPWINSLVVYQSLKNVSQHFKYLFIPLCYFQDNYDTINNFRELDLLIICQTSEEKDHSKILKALGVMEGIIVNANDVSKRIIFITFDNEFFERTQLTKFPYFGETLTICFSDLEEEFQRNLLEEEIFFFQRSKEKRSLKQILCLGEEGMNQKQIEKLDLNCRALEVLFKNRVIDLWRKRPWFSDLACAHYNPNIELESEQVIETIHLYPDDVFAFKGDKSEVEQLLRDQECALHSSAEIESEFSLKIPRFIHLKGNAAEFRRWCHLVDENDDYEKGGISRQAIHFLKQTGNKWKWKDTYDKKIYMRRKLCTVLNEEHSILTEEDLTKSKHRLILLAGKHGSGKTFTLTRLAELIKKEKPYSLVIKVDLKQHKKKFASKTWKTISGLVELILLCGKVPERNPLMQNILAYKLQFPEHVYILWDHFDEIEPEIQSNVLDILDSFKKHTECTMCFATRQNGKLLENELSSEVYTFETWNEENQQKFLIKYWGNALKFSCKNTEQILSDLLQNLAKEVIDDFQRFMPERNGIKSILSIPLNLRLVAETFLKKNMHTTLHNTCSPYFPPPQEKLLTTDIYHSFVDKNFDIYLDETAEELDIGSRSILKESYTDAYGELAFKKFCGDSQIYENCSPEKKSKIPLNILSRIGLIEREEESTSKFGHHSIAEYFVVEQISRKLLNTPTSKPIWDLLLNEIMMFRHCRRFFDDKLIRERDLVNFASRTDQKEIVYGIISNQVDCSRSVLWYAAVDNLERTLVFFAKCAVDFDSLKRISVAVLKKCICPREGCKKLIETFFEYGNELDANRIKEFIVDETNNLLVTAITEKDTENITLLLKHVKDGDQILQIIQSRSPSGKTALHFAVKASNPSIIEKCIEKLNKNQREIIFNTPDVFNRTPSDYTSRYMKNFYSCFGEYIWNLKQKLRYTKGQKEDYTIFSDLFARRIKDIYSHSKLRKFNLGLHFPVFEARKTVVHGAVIARAFSQFLFLVGIEETFAVMQIVKKFYMSNYWRNLKLDFRENISAPKEFCRLIYSFINFAEDLDLKDKSLPSKFVVHTDFETITCLHNYVKRIKNEVNFSIHLIMNDHVLVIYRINGSYAYFDRNAVFVSDLQTTDELISVLEKATEFSDYQIHEQYFSGEHFDVEKANGILSDECKEAVKTAPSWKKSFRSKKSSKN